MSPAAASSEEARRLLGRFGTLRPQGSEDWQGEMPLPRAVASFYAEVGPDDLTLPTTGNPIWLPPLARLWETQAGYRWDGRTGARLPDWPAPWLVVADQGGDPFIFDADSGAVLHARSGSGGWKPLPLFANLIAMATGLGTLAAVHEAAGADLYYADFEVRPRWRAAVREGLAERLGPEVAEVVAARLGW